MTMIVWPAVITLAITVLRLFGELQGWSTALFNPAAGGGGAVIGISWLPPIFGGYFAWKLVGAGQGTQTPGKVAGVSAAGTFGVLAVAAGANALGPVASLLGVAVASVVASLLVARAWKPMGLTLFGYALAARIPVAIIMLVAIYGDWGTHYDVLPPDPSPELVAMGPLGRWFWIGLLPQMTFWVGYTMLVGMLFGALTVLIGKPKPSA